jgi:hypothetical protein
LAAETIHPACMCEGGGHGGREAVAHSTTPTYTVRRDGPARELSWSAFWLQKPSILRACVREEDAGGREAGAPGTREEPGTLTQGAPVFPGSSRLGIEPKTPGWLVTPVLQVSSTGFLGIEPKTPGWLVQDPTTRPIGTREEPGTVCVYYCRTYYNAVRGGGRRRVDDMCYDRRRAEACVDESARHALANTGGREIAVLGVCTNKTSAIHELKQMVRSILFTGDCPQVSLGT